MEKDLLYSYLKEVSFCTKHYSFCIALLPLSYLISISIICGMALYRYLQNTNSQGRADDFWAPGFTAVMGHSHVRRDKIFRQ